MCNFKMFDKKKEIKEEKEITEAPPQIQIEFALHQIRHAVNLLSSPENYRQLEAKDRAKKAQECKQAHFGLAYNVND